MVPLLGIVSRQSNMGKTTLVRELIVRLTDLGYRVGAIKKVHQMQLDQEGKDSWVFQQAGACAVAILGQNQTVLIRKTQTPELPDRLMAELGNPNLVLVEGFKELAHPKVEVLRQTVSTEPITPFDQLFALVSDFPFTCGNVPCFRFEEIELLVSQIEKILLRPQNPSLAQLPLSTKSPYPTPFRSSKSTSPSPPDSDSLTHLDAEGKASMVDVSAKPETLRTARAKGCIRMSPRTLSFVREGKLPKGDVCSVARIAAIQGVKETSRLIPLCHPLPITHIEASLELKEPDTIEVCVGVKTKAATGVEMEALTGVQIALLTIYDMCKAVDKEMVLENIHLLEKTGGQRGDYRYG